jgi:hypothetical protein
LSALALKAKASGQEIADYAADVLTRDVIDRLKPTDAERIRAELELKTEAIKYAREQTAKKFDEHVTLKVFQHIRETPELCALYVRAIGGASPYVRGNQIQARINRTLGAAIKIAVRREAQDPERQCVESAGHAGIHLGLHSSRTRPQRRMIAGRRNYDQAEPGVCGPFSGR